MKKLLIVTGPQGSGNHVFSRIFSMHECVGGWKELVDKYWVPSDLEPFAEYWVYPERLTKEVFDGYEYWLANVSVPFVYDGVRQTPKILEFAERAKQLGIDVKIAIIVRDQNIQAEQQLRVRKEVTLPMFKGQLPNIWNPVFLSYELLYLYKQDYLKSLRLNIPVAWDDSRINEILADDANAKYVHNIEYNELDNGNRLGVTFKTRP